jgi:SagB-type dehydrogenase family enzyme
VRVRRARAALAYWKDGAFLLDNYETRVTVSADPVTVQILHFFDDWRRPEELRQRFPDYTPASLRKAVRDLTRHSLLVREGSPEAVRDAAIAREWAPWLPEAGFHFATKNAPYIDPQWDVSRLIAILPKTPQPTFVKRQRGRIVRLPPRRPVTGEFERVLHARKTHREFTPGAVPLSDVSHLLSTVWGVQGHRPSPIFGQLFHKTSPSGGARHPGEVYVIAHDVEGLKPGIYHYDPVKHRLATIHVGTMRAKTWRYSVHQKHARDAAALFVMTAVFPRTMWKYHAARAYRVVLLDAGHLCQTFLLTATAMGLGPFCTAALNDTLIEHDLRIDGITESVLYLAGVGVPRPLSSGGRGRRRPST